MSSVHYLLAKYIPDLWRMEPRNIGVVLWTPDGIEARFLAEKPGNPGEVDGRRVPSFVTSISAYKQWIRYWRDAICGPSLMPARGGPPIPRSFPDFMEALKTASKGNFLLEDGGMLLDPVHADDLPNAVDYLFAMLVAAEPAEEPRDPSLEDRCTQLIDACGLRTDPHFISRYKVACRTEELEFSYAYRNGSLRRLYQRVPLLTPGVSLRKTIHDSAWMFLQATRADFIRRDQGVALIYATEEQQADRELSGYIQVLREEARVLNLHNEAEGLEEFRSLTSAVYR